MGNSFFNEYPYTDFHELNLSWVIKELRSFATTLEQFVSINALKYADPIQWDITSQYEKNTIVIDPQSGTAYISVAPVPAGVALTNPDYWTIVFDLERFVTKANGNFTLRVETQTTTTATFPVSSGEWVIWGGDLYRALSNIIAGDQYVVDSNIERITVEEIKDELLVLIDNINTIIGDLSTLTTTDKTSIVNAINEVVNSIGDLANLNTTDKTSIVNAINEIITNVTSIIGDLADLTTTDKTSVVNAINEVDGDIGDLANLNTTDKTSVVNAINEVGDNIGDLANLNTTDKTSVVNAINEVDGDIGDLTSLATVDKSSVVDAINEIYGHIGDFPLINVKDYGVIGDGVTDDSTAINTLITNVNTNGGGVLYFPPGTYKVNNSIMGKSNVSLQGDNAIIDITDVPEETDLGYGHHLGIYYKGSKTRIGSITTDLPFTGYSVTITDASSLQVDDYIELASTSVIMPYQTVNDGAYKGEIFRIVAIAGNTLTLDHGSYAIFTSAEGVDVYKLDLCSNFTIRGITVQSNAGANSQIDGIYLWLCNKAIIDGCKINGVDWYSIGIVESININVINNFITGTWYDGNTGSIFFGIAVLNASQWINICNNHAEKVRHLYVNTAYFNTHVVVGVPRCINVIGNIAKNLMYAGNGASYAYQHHGSGSDINIIGNIADSCYAGIGVEGERVNIIGNIIKNAKYQGVLIGNALYCDHINVKDNFIYALTTQVSTALDGESCGGIMLYNRRANDSINNISITGNHIEFYSQWHNAIGMYNTPISNIDVSDNFIFDLNYSTYALPAIQAIGDNITIKDNNINAQYGINTAGPGIEIMSNKIKSRDLTGSYRGIDSGWDNAKVFNNLIENFAVGIFTSNTAFVIGNAAISCTTSMSGTPSVNQYNYVP